jgi:hypothetical protein
MKKILLLIALLSSLSIYSQTTTWDGFFWNNGNPNSIKNVIINGPYDTSNNGVIECNNLIVNSGGSLVIALGDYCNVYGNIDVSPTGNIFVQSGGSLIPSNNSCITTGVVSVERRTPLLKRYDYTYWSSPVTTNLGDVLLPTNWDSGRIFTFNTSNYFDIETSYWGNFISNVPDGQDDNGDAWTECSITDNMIPGKGYASMIKSLQSTGVYPRFETVVFTGHLNTGIKTIPLSLSQNTVNDTDDFNLVGNPYSSSINSNDFIDDNISNISGTLYFWTHTNTLSTSFSGLEMFNFSTNDYAKYTKLGGIRAVFGGRLPSNVIGSGQGFLIEAENTGDLIFKPNMMSNAYSNTTSVSFFKEKDRKEKKGNLWLDMENSDFFSEQLIGYNNETDLSYNKGWDSNINIINVPLKFYSVEEDIKYDIQSRGNFDNDDVVTLGYFSAIDGQFTISVNQKDGKLKNKNIYLCDDSLNICHNLSNPYTFTTISGTFNDRFTIRYELPEDEDEDDKQVTITNKNSNVNIKSDSGIITNLKFFDLSGRLIKEYNKDFIEMNFLDLPKGIFIIKMTINGEIVTKKIIL